MDYAALRKRMVEQQLSARGIKNSDILEVFYRLERHKFMPEELANAAYSDFPLPIGEGQTISQPYIVALMVDNLNLSGSEKVLEIGTGSGYQTAVLAELAAEVCSVEVRVNLAENTQALLSELGYANIKIKVGDGSMGWVEEAPFDRIIISAATTRIPLPLVDQLKEGGRIILPQGSGFRQALTYADKIDGKLKTKEICGCVFVPMTGKYSDNAGFNS